MAKLDIGPSIPDMFLNIAFQIQLAFQFIPNVFCGVEVSPLEIFHCSFGKPCIHGARSVHRSIVMLECLCLIP